MPAVQQVRHDTKTDIIITPCVQNGWLITSGLENADILFA
jgi:hypothetical protein